MKKKNLLSLILVVLLVLSLGMGTFAYYTKTFTSEENVVRSAKFIVDSKGTLDNNMVFDLTDDPIYPGINKDVYEFIIDKTGTEVPVGYKLIVSGNGELFSPIDGVESPVGLSVFRKSGDTWIAIENDSEIDPTEDVENFKINLEWNHDNVNDIKFQGKTGNISINVVATQLDKVEEPPTEPDPDQLAVEVAKAYVIGLGNGGLRNTSPTQLNSVYINIPSYANQIAKFWFSEDYEYGEEERKEGIITVRTTDSNTGNPSQLSVKRNEDNEYSAKIKLLIVKGEYSDFVTYEITVPKNGKRSDPFLGTPAVPAEPVTVRLLP